MSTRHHRRLAAVAAAVAALTLTACGSSGTSPDGGSGSGSASDNPQAKAAAKLLAINAGAVEGFAPPGPAIKDVAALAGSTVYYVPATLAAPALKALGDSLTESLAAADVKVQVCDAKTNPSALAACLQQVVQAEAGAVVTAGLPREFATVGFKNVADAGIPWVNMNTLPAGPGDPKLVGYLTPDFVQMHAWSANWVIADSGGKAEVLVVNLTDSPAVKTWMERGALATYEKACPDCKVTKIDTSTAQFQKLPSLISSALVKNPGIKYVHGPYDGALQPIIQGVQAAGKTQDVEIASVDASMAAMNMIKDGRTVGVETGFNNNALAWYGADQALRMMSGQASLQNVKFPYRRIFTADNVAELELTPKAENSGAWFGNTEYKNGFEKLWGLAG